MSTRVIGITDGRFYESYAQWIIAAGDVELVQLGYRYNNAKALKDCQGLFLTGGEDIHPRHYQKPEYVTRFNLHDFDEARDDFELELLSLWRTLDIPLLGVCRGMQLTNVFLGGTLIPDLPSFGKFNHAKKNKMPRNHPIWIDTESDLFDIVSLKQGEVTSMHHQSIDQIAPGLVVNALSTDGVIEGVEWLDKSGQQPAVLVQWHPEVMQDQQSPLTKNIRDYFLSFIE